MRRSWWRRPGVKDARATSSPTISFQCFQILEEEVHNNTGVAMQRKNALFAGSDGGGRFWALAMTLIQTAKLNGDDPMAWLADALERIVSGRTKMHDVHTLLPWAWAAANSRAEDKLLAA